jgi:hypothetical protein
MPKATKTDMTFARCEEKYLLTFAQYEPLCGFLGGITVPDAHAQYKVNNVYYDTATYAVIRRSIEKPTPLYKEKLRLRYYGNSSQPPDSVFLELKKKFNGIVYKRRISLKKSDVAKFFAGETADCQIAGEIRVFLNSIDPIVNEVAISYERQALTGIGGFSDLRITFDTRVRYEGHDLLEQGQVLMEIKSATAMPLELARYLSENAVFPSSFSKYKAAYTNHIFKEEGEKSLCLIT